MKRLLALGLFLSLSLALFGSWVDPRTSILDGGRDALSFVWFLEWWPWAITRGINPFITRLVWAPGGYNLTWGTPVPTAALLAFPVTWFVNAVASYNLLLILAPALSAWTGFLLAIRATRDWTAAIVAGTLFGFSAYVAGQMHGHLNLALVFLLPLAVLLVWERAANELSGRGFVAWLTLLLVMQFGLSVEVFASLCLFGSAAFVVVMLVERPISRVPMLRLAGEILVAGLLSLVVVSPYLAYMALGRAALGAFVNSPRAYSTDLANFIIPTGVTWLSSPETNALAARFPGNGTEQGAYLGLPLIAIVALDARGRWRRPGGKALLLTMLGLATASLGPFLWVEGTGTSVPLPWLAMIHLPLIRGALPARFSIYVMLAAALIAAGWVAGARTVVGRRGRLALAFAACAAVLPKPGVLQWRPTPALPFFAPDHAEARIGSHANLVLLPYGPLGPGMFWQAQSKLAFSQSGGNLSFIPLRFQRYRVLPTLYGAPPTPSFANDILAFCAENRVTAVVAGPDTPQDLLSALDRLGWEETETGGVDLFRVPTGAADYVSFSGDFWPGADTWSVMGRRISVVARGTTAHLQLSAILRPNLPVEVTITDGTSTRRIVVDGTVPTSLEVAANHVVQLEASTVFRPDSLFHNGDRRDVSLLVNLLPR